MNIRNKLNKRTVELSITPQYDIYIFKSSNSHNSPVWERKYITSCPKQARRHAEELLQTNAYQKVEIQKRYFDTRNECIVTCTVKIYEQKSKKDAGKIFSGLLLAASIAMLTAAVFFINP
jgi:hypothetical protein